MEGTNAMPWGLYDAFRTMVMGAGPRVGEKTAVAGLKVSTVLTWDLGYETAVIDAGGTYPVERYDTEGAAGAGHRRWVAAAPTLTTVTMLGTGDGAVPDEVVTLTPRTPEE